MSGLTYSGVPLRLRARPRRTLASVSLRFDFCVVFLSSLFGNLICFISYIICSVKIRSLRFLQTITVVLTLHYITNPFRVDWILLDLTEHYYYFVTELLCCIFVLWNLSESCVLYDSGVMLFHFETQLYSCWWQLVRDQVTLQVCCVCVWFPNAVP